MFEFRMPDIGEGVIEGEVVRWKVQEGETVLLDQPMVEVMTDKATVEIPSPRAGKIAKIMYLEGQAIYMLDQCWYPVKKGDSIWMAPYCQQWATAMGQILRLARPGWWHRPPFLPVPDPGYLRFRLETQYGSDRDPIPADLVTYLHWCRGFRHGT